MNDTTHDWLNLDAAVPPELRDRLNRAREAVAEIAPAVEKVCRDAFEAHAAYTERIQAFDDLPDDFPYNGFLGQVSGHDPLDREVRQVGMYVQCALDDVDFPAPQWAGEHGFRVPDWYETFAQRRGRRVEAFTGSDVLDSDTREGLTTAVDALRERASDHQAEVDAIERARRQLDDTARERGWEWGGPEYEAARKALGLDEAIAMLDEYVASIDKARGTVR